MPDDRFLHKRAGHSEKVSLLNDLEYRVWTQYLLSADDFGVMRYSAITIQADNAALELRPAKAITAALNQLVTVKLVRPFYHQNRAYLFQHNWQDFQKITYPRKSIEPPAPADLCSRETQWLLTHHPGGCRMSSWKAPEDFVCELVAVFPEDFGKVSGTLPKNSLVPLAVSRKPLAVSQEPVSGPAVEPPPTPQRLVSHWNEHRKPGPQVDTITASRKALYGKALETHPNLDEWEQVIRWLNRQAWANAPGTGTHPNWRATLDWLAKPGKLAEKLELAKADQATPTLVSQAGQSTQAAAEIVKAALRKQA